jgi:UPF0755 protein
MKLILKRVFWAALVAPALFLLWLTADGTRPYLHSHGPVHLDISRGMRTREIATQLETTGVIRSRWTFLGLLLMQWPATLKAGEYSFEKPASTARVLAKLIRGDVSYEVVTVPEGLNRFEIADIIAAQGFSTREEFLLVTEDATVIADLDSQARSLEGYLFPDSYHFPRHARPAQIVQAMVDRFRNVLAGLGVAPRKAPDSSQQTGSSRPVREIVILASLVEEETGVADERAIVAGVFYNRLERGLLLQADPTVAYAALVERGYGGRIRRSDLAYDSPYNTYLHPGLPPGPVSNPGRAALRAAVQPQATDFLYFVAKVDGGHTFSRTLVEHNAAVAEYRQAVNAARAEAALLNSPSGDAAGSQ